MVFSENVMKIPVIRKIFDKNNNFEHICLHFVTEEKFCFLCV